MSATQNQESTISVNAKPLDKAQDSGPKKPFEPLTNSLKDTTAMMNSGSPFRHPTFFNRNLESPAQKQSPFRNLRERNRRFGAQMSQERRRLDFNNSPFRDCSLDARDGKEEQRKNNGNNNNSSIQNTPLTALIKSNKAKEEEENQFSNYATGLLRSPYSSNFGLCQSQDRRNYSHELLTQFQGRSPLRFTGGSSSNILKKGILNRTSSISQSNEYCLDLKRQLFFDQKFEPNKEIDQRFQSPYVKNSNRKGTLDETTPLTIRQKSPMIDEQYHQQFCYQQYYPHSFDNRAVMIQNPVSYYNNLQPAMQIEQYQQMQQQQQQILQQQQIQQQQQQYEVSTKKDSNQICIFRSNSSSTRIQQGSDFHQTAQTEHVELQNGVNYNRQSSSTKKSSFYSTGKKSSKRLLNNPQCKSLFDNPCNLDHFKDQIQTQNQPYRVPMGKFIKQSPYSNQQRLNHYDSSNCIFNDPLSYRNSNQFQSSNNAQPVLRKQPTFGVQTQEFLERVPQSFHYSNSNHHHHHHYHHHCRNGSQDQNQYGYLDQVNPPLQVQRKMEFKRKQQSIRYNSHRLMKSNSSYEQQDYYHHHPKQMHRRCEQIVDILPTTHEKSDQHSSGKKLKTANKENHGIISNDLHMSSNNIGGILSQSIDGDTFKPCSCSKSKCLKKYCECFSAGRYCRNQCNCCGCMNNTQFEDKRQEALQKQKDGGKIQKIGQIQGKIQHLKGCTCKRSNCIKNYCECFQNNIPCGNSCKCVCCKNTHKQRQLRRQTSSFNTNNYNQLQQQQYYDNNQDDIGYKLNSYHNYEDSIDNNVRDKYIELIKEQTQNLSLHQQDKEGKYTFGNISAQQNSNTSPTIKKPSEQSEVSKNNYSVESRASIQRNGVKSNGILGMKDTQGHVCTEFTPSPFKKIQNEWSSIKKKNTNIGSRNSKQILQEEGFDDEDQQQYEQQLGYGDQQQNYAQQRDKGLNLGIKQQQEKQKSKRTMDQLKLVGSTRSVPNDKNTKVIENKNMMIKKKKVTQQQSNINNNNLSGNKNIQSASNLLYRGNKNSQNKRNVNKSLFDEKELMDNIENSIIITDIKRNKKRLKRNTNLVEKVQDQGLEQTKKPQLRKKSQRLSQKQVKAQ